LKNVNRLPLAAGEELDEFLGRLHETVQNAMQISPSAWQGAQRRLQSVLGATMLAALTADSQHFLTAAEVFFAASQGVPEIDLALIIVEYAKAVENELRDKLAQPFSNQLDRRNWRGPVELREAAVPFRGQGT
jgi:hypothetical protein